MPEENKIKQLGEKIQEVVEKVVDETKELVEKATETEEDKDKKELDKLSAKEFSKKLTEREKVEEELKSWGPKTQLGRQVKSGKIEKIDEIFDKGLKILEPEIVDKLLKLESEVLFIGQSKGKFGGGKRRAWRQTQKKTKEGNVPVFSAMVAVGNKNGYVGLGRGKAKETLPARTKAIRKAKLELFKVNRGCGSFDCSCEEHHSIPFEVEGKCGSTKIKLMPAPQGTGLVIGDEGKKILKLAGIKDVYSKSFGHIRSTMNLSKATIAALKKLNEVAK